MGTGSQKLPAGLHEDNSGTAVVLLTLPVTWNGVFWRKWKRKGTDKLQRIQCTERKAPYWGLVKRIKGSIRLWNFLSQPISVRSRVNKLPGLSNMHIWLRIAANWQFTVRLWLAQSSVITAKQHFIRRLCPNSWLPAASFFLSFLITIGPWTNIAKFCIADRYSPKYCMLKFGDGSTVITIKFNVMVWEIHFCLYWIVDSRDGRI